MKLLKLPKYQKFNSELIPEGTYVFEIIGNPEVREGRKGGEYLILKLAVKFPDGTYRKFNQIMAPWEDRYGDLLRALGGEVDDEDGVDLGEIELIGMEFKADVVHEADRQDSSIIRERLVNIRPAGLLNENADKDMF